MRYKTYALLISGIFSLLLMPSTFAMEGKNPGSFSWRPLADQNVRTSSGKGLFRQVGYSIRPESDPRRWRRHYPQQVQQSYRFRPWSDGHAQVYRPATDKPATGPSAHDRALTAYQAPSAVPLPQPPTHSLASTPVVNSGGSPGYGLHNPHGFRPMDQQPRRGTSNQWTYRPAQLNIPNHYVYRPLRPQNTRYRGDRQHNRRVAPMPGVNNVAFRAQDPVYHGYQSSRLPMMPYRTASYPRPHYYSGPYHYPDPYQYPIPYNRFAANRTADGNSSQGERIGKQRAWSRWIPRYTGQVRYNRYRFRPLDRPQWGRYSYPKQPDINTAYPYPVSDYQRIERNRNHYNTIKQAWPPSMVLHYPGMQNPAAPNRHGVDWYDGMGDGEGAWYKLTAQQAWPRVSQYSPLE
jgi:hypothetical protein